MKAVNTRNGYSPTFMSRYDMLSYACKIIIRDALNPTIQINFLWIAIQLAVTEVAERGDTDNETRILGQRVLRDIQGAL